MRLRRAAVPAARSPVSANASHTLEKFKSNCQKEKGAILSEKKDPFYG